MEAGPPLIHFIDKPVEVVFDQPPLLEKAPPCPDGFRWEGQVYRVTKILAEWHDFGRRGRMERNMRPEHAQRAAQMGSWGVGRYYFRVQVTGGRIFDLYYDRSPGKVGDRKGTWFLLGERKSPA